MMFLRQGSQDLTKKNEDRIKELEISLAKLEADVAADFKELNLTLEQIDAFFQNRDNFTEDEWKEVLSVREDLNKRLLNQNSMLADAKSVAEARASLPRHGNWIAVR